MSSVKKKEEEENSEKKQLGPEPFGCGFSEI